jgi:hypothetical protein
MLTLCKQRLGDQHLAAGLGRQHRSYVSRSPSSIEGWLDELCQHGLLAVFELVKVLQSVQCYQGSNTLLVNSLNCNLYLHKVFDKS